MPNNVRKARKDRGWTIQRLHEETGLSHGFLSEIETGKKVPNVINAIIIARALGRDVNDLFPVSTAQAV